MLPAAITTRASRPILSEPICRLLPSSGITLLRWYYETIRLPATDLPSSLWAVVGHTLGLSPLTALSCSSESSGRVSRVAVQSRCHACHGLRPRGSIHHLALSVMPVLTSARFDAVVLPVDLITGLYPFNLSAYGLPARWPTLRVQHYCCDSQGLATRWLARPSEMGFSPTRLHGIARSLQNRKPDPDRLFYFPAFSWCQCFWVHLFMGPRAPSPARSGSSNCFPR